MELFYSHQFEAPIVTHDVGSDRYVYTVVFVPADLVAELPLREHPRLRITGEVEGHPLEASLTPVRGRWYLLLSKKLLEAIGAKVGEQVTVSFNVADQNAVSLPEELQRALEANPSAADLWRDQTPGRQRGLAYRVASAKTSPTRAKRIQEVFDILEGKRDLKGRPLRSGS
ncbi:MAG: YdeI/OmpD-associated family protein [Acidobacteriota bacterium]